jgi:hypothetical protein
VPFRNEYLTSLNAAIPWSNQVKRGSSGFEAIAEHLAKAVIESSPAAHVGDHLGGRYDLVAVTRLGDWAYLRPVATENALPSYA